MGLLSFIFFILPLAFAEIPDLDPNKFTICAMTINSDNERAVFEKEIKKNPTKFNPMVELTEFDEEDWFNKACESGIKCDQLIISGHFGGTFFGSSGKSLSIDQLENKGCSKTCEGILSHPYEVFLMGCNTLATKEKDARTPEQYLQILLNDGISRRDAEMVVESRYGNVGDDHRSKMQRAFAGSSKQLYGFDSVGPSGKSVEQFLKNYFKKAPLRSRLEKLQARRMMNQVEKSNADLGNALKSTHFVECHTGASSEDDKSRIICTLRDEGKSVDVKLAAAREAMAYENYLTFIPSINAFLQEYPTSKMNSEQMKTINEIAANKTIKSQIQNMVRKTKSLTLLSEWLNFAENFGFVDKDEEKKLMTEAIKKTFKNNLSLDEKDLICSFSDEQINMIDLKSSDLNEKLNAHTVYALGCLKVKDKEIHLRLVDGLSDSDSGVRYYSAGALGKIRPQSREVHLRLAEKLKDADPKVRYIACWGIGELRSKDKEVHLKLVEALRDSDLDIRSIATGVLKKLRPADQDVLNRIKELDPKLYKELAK